MTRSMFFISCPWHVRIGVHTVEYRGQTISNQDEILERLCNMVTGARWHGSEACFSTRCDIRQPLFALVYLHNLKENGNSAHLRRLQKERSIY
jgi:hypothetical protein